MYITLALSAFLLGMVGVAHCAAMCGPACAAVTGGSRGAPGGTVDPSAAVVGFQLARAVSYASAGAVAAAGVGWMGSASVAGSVLRPVWTLLHMAALTLGLLMAWTGRQPALMSRLARRSHGHAAPGGWQKVRGPGAAVAAGAVWAAWPCGLLHSALVVAGLANTPQGGAMVMLSFATASSAGLLAGPWAWSRWVASPGYPGRAKAAERRSRLLVRAAGALLALGSTWSLGMDVWGRVWTYCVG